MAFFDSCLDFCPNEALGQIMSQKINWFIISDVFQKLMTKVNSSQVFQNCNLVGWLSFFIPTKMRLADSFNSLLAANVIAFYFCHEELEYTKSSPINCWVMNFHKLWKFFEQLKEPSVSSTYRTSWCNHLCFFIPEIVHIYYEPKFRKMKNMFLFFDGFIENGQVSSNNFFFEFSCNNWIT